MNKSLIQYIKESNIVNTNFENIDFGYFIGCLCLNNGIYPGLAKERYIFENYIIAKNTTVHMYKKCQNNNIYYSDRTESIISKNLFCIYNCKISLTDDNWIINWYPEDHHMHHPEFKTKIFTLLCCLKRTRELTGNIQVYKVPKYILFEIIKKSVYVIL